jgi:predicted nucleotidyltransferase
MHNRIIAKLDEIEQREQVRILHAVESGSRAWGFASSDSDYDVRFIYVRSPQCYLRLDKTRDVIEWQLDDVFDINGWDLQKALRLLYSSNPTLFEWSNSPILYKTTDEWAAIQKEFGHYFSVKSELCHYLNIASNNWREPASADTFKLKKYFYVLRPILACRWILRNHCPPPLPFWELAEAELAPEMRPDVENLLARKMSASEIDAVERMAGLDAYIGSELASLKVAIDLLPFEEAKGWERLNELFWQTLGVLER